MVRQSRKGPHYSDLFVHEATTRGASSTDRLSLSSATNTVPETQLTHATSEAPPPAPTAAPPQPPPPAAAGGVHLDLLVPPPEAPYAHYTVEDLFIQPGREGLKRLDPNRPLETYWFGVDNKVGRSVSNTIKAYFTDPHPNWSSTPDHINKTWFKYFAQKWNWEIGINEQVKQEFNAKAMRRLANTVSDWKEIWQVKGINGKPIFLSQAVWEGLIHFWQDPNSVRVSGKCLTSKLTVDEDELLPTPHTARKYLLRAEKEGQLPSLSRLF